jgi:hypothetical protein
MISSLLSGILLKYVLPIVGVLAVLFGAYEYGHSRGSAQGYQEAWSVQQQTINKMVSEQNQQAEDNNKKIAEIESDSFESAFKVRQLQSQLQKQRTQIVKDYVQQNPQTSQSCGLDIPMVESINKIIQTGTTANQGDAK